MCEDLPDIDWTRFCNGVAILSSVVGLVMDPAVSRLTV
jgi:hypothetical protein